MTNSSCSVVCPGHAIDLVTLSLVLRAWWTTQAAWRHNRVHVLIVAFLVVTCPLNLAGFIVRALALTSLLVRVVRWERSIHQTSSPS
jgi:hypothetical protein